MISENDSGLPLNPWAVVMPAALIAVLTISINVLGDALARTRDQSIDVRSMRR
jgi:peptide/nickel transport system permease protein